MMNKKGQIMDNLGGLAIGVAILAITLTISFLVIGEGREEINDTLAVTTFNNQTLAQSNYSAVAFNNDCLGSVTCLAASNDSGAWDAYVPTANYTCNISGFTFQDAGNTSYNPATTLYINYSCKIADAGYNSTLTLASAVDEIPGWVPLIIIAVVGIVMLGLVAMFRR
jgi:hypothetical protein